METQYTAYIAEDDQTNLYIVKEFLNEIDDIKLVGDSENGLDAIDQILKLQPNLLIMDIMLPGKTGMEICREIIENEYFPHIIFMSSHAEYAISAFHIGAIDFIKKPVERDRFHKALDRYRAAFHSGLLKRYDRISNPGLILNTNTYQISIPFRKIIYISGSGRHSAVHTQGQDYHSTLLLKKIQELLPEQQFCRISKNFIVNLDYIDSLEYNKSGIYNLKLADDMDILSVRPSYLNHLRSLLDKKWKIE